MNLNRSNRKRQYRPKSVKTSQLRFAAKHFKRRADASDIAAALAEEYMQLSNEDSDRWRDGNSVRQAVTLARAVYNAGRMTWEEYFFYSLLPVECYHNHLIDNGLHEARLKPLDEKMERIRNEYGLSSDQYWTIDQEPPEYRKLSKQYEKILRSKFETCLRDFELISHARLWSRDRTKFDQIREAGRAAFFEINNLERATLSLIENFGGEARKCEKANAYYAACTMLTSASEALLLLKCIQNPRDLEEAQSKVPSKINLHKGGPQYWSLGQLVCIANLANWLPNIKTGDTIVYTEKLLKHMGSIRNLIHPGKHVNEKPHSTIGKEQYKDTMSAYIALKFSLQEKGKLG